MAAEEGSRVPGKASQVAAVGNACTTGVEGGGLLMVWEDGSVGELPFFGERAGKSSYMGAGGREKAL